MGFRNPHYLRAGVLHPDFARHQADQRAEQHTSPPIQIHDTSGNNIGLDHRPLLSSDMPPKFRYKILVSRLRTATSEVPCLLAV